jgi:hypothetical protein
MTARRKSLAALTFALLLASTAWLTLRHRSHEALVRVGGMGNACACTHRIEP